MSKLLSRRGLLQSAGAGVLLIGCKDGCSGPATGTSTSSSSSSSSGADAARESAAAPVASDTIKVGVVLTLSGPQSSVGKELEQGLNLALENAGMRAGGKKIELIKKDDKNDPTTGGELAKALIEQDKVDLLVGPSHSNVALALRNVVHDSKTLLINPSAGASALAGALCSPYIYSSGRMNPLYAEALGRYMAKKGIKTVAVIAANYSAGLDMVQGFRETFVNEGDGKVVGELLPPLTTTDFAPHLAQLKAMKAEAVFAFFVGESAIHFIKQYAQAGLKGKLPLYCTGYTVEQDVLAAQGEAALGILSVSVYSPMLDNEVNKKFAPAYLGRYGTYPSEYSVLAYDAGQVLLAAVNAVGGKVDDKVGLLNAMSTVSIESPRGNFKFGPNHTPVQDAYLREVVKTPDGKLVNKMISVAWPAYYYPGEGCMLPGAKR